MIIANCPRCGSMNNTAGICPNCGWSQFAQVTTVSTRITGEIEIMLSGKALLDDYKRLLFENRNLKVRIAELEGKIDQLTAHDATERQDDKSSNRVATPIDVALRKRIAELEAERDYWRKSYMNLWRHINNLPQPPEGKE